LASAKTTPAGSADLPIGVPWAAWLAALMSLVIAAADGCDGEAARAERLQTIAS
jgi:phosphatidylglycerophosphate synthase